MPPSPLRLWDPFHFWNILEFVKTIVFYISFSALLCYYGCIDRFCCGALDFQEFRAPRGAPLGTLEKPSENHCVEPPNKGGYHGVGEGTVRAGRDTMGVRGRRP